MENPVKVPDVIKVHSTYHSVFASTVCTVILTVGTRKGRLGRGKQQLLTIGNKIGQPTTRTVACFPSRCIVDLKQKCNVRSKIGKVGVALNKVGVPLL